MATQDGPLDDQHRPGTKDREASVAGSLSDMGVADLVQTLEMGKKSGVLHLKARTGARATCHFRNGRVIDCELGGALQGEEAFYRILRWHEGGFAIEFRPSEREERIQLPTQALLLQGMRRIDEWRRVVEQLPPLDRRLEVDVGRLGERLSKIPDGANTLLRLFDGRRTLAQVIEAAPGGDLAAAETISRMVADGILTELRTAAPPEGAPLDVEPPRAVTPSPVEPSPEPGGVDWFAGPVGPEAGVAPVVSWVLTPVATEPERAAVVPEGGGDWLEPPLPGPDPSAVARASSRARAAPPGSAPRFSMPVPPPGSLPPPPSVAQTLARHRVAPRVASLPAPEPVAGSPELPSTQGEPVAAPAGSTPVPALPEPVAPTSRTAEPPPGPAEPAPAPIGKGSTPLETGSLPLHLGAPPARSHPPVAPAKRSALPYVALGAMVLAALAAGAALTRRPPLDAPPATEAAATPGLAAAPADTAAAAPPGASPAAPADPVSAPTPAAATADPVGAPAPPGAPATVADAHDDGSPAPAARPATPDPAPATVAPAPPAAEPAPPAAAHREPRPAAAPSPTTEEVDTRKLLAAADRKYKAGRYADAIADYRRVVALRPTPAARIALARALYDGNRSADAMRELDTVIAANSRDASAWLLRGDIHQGEGRPDEARAAYQRFLELEPRGEQAKVVRMILGRDLE